MPLGYFFRKKIVYRAQLLGSQRNVLFEPYPIMRFGDCLLGNMLPPAGQPKKENDKNYLQQRRYDRGSPGGSEGVFP